MDKYNSIISAIVLITVFGMFTSCTYQSQVNYNECIISAQSEKIAGLCRNS
jgi:hypothetical protein